MSGTATQTKQVSISEARTVLFMSTEVFNRTVAIVLDGKLHSKVLDAHQLFIMVLADFCYSLMPWSEPETQAFLRAIRDDLKEISEELWEVFYHGDPMDKVPDYSIKFPESKYATWPEYDYFFFPRKSIVLNRLPSPSVYVTVVHAGALLFNVLRQVHNLRDKDGPKSEPPH